MRRRPAKKAKDRAARTACLSGNVQKGIDILSHLYVRTMDPIFLYNQGRCFEQNGRYEDAIPRFREYLLKAKRATVEEKSDAEKHIGDCQAAIRQKSMPRQEAPVAARTEVSLPPSPPPPQPPAVSIPLSSSQSSTSPTAPAQDRGRGLRIAGIACGAVGLASTATAIYFYARARSYSERVANQEVRNPSDDAAGRDAEAMQWVFHSVGGAALATGAVLYALGWTQKDGPMVVGVVPLIGGGGISAQGAF
jgi:hypothetical protein